MASTSSSEASVPEKDVWKKAEPTFTSKRNSEYFDPCQDFANASFKCLSRNAGDKTMCQDYFQAYRDCKKEWVRFGPQMGKRLQLTRFKTTRRKEDKKAASSSWFSKD